jgi:hypothetical protein
MNGLLTANLDKALVAVAVKVRKPMAPCRTGACGVDRQTLRHG